MDDDATAGQRVFPEFDRDIHVVPDDQIPERLCCYMGTDPHPRTPHAHLWLGIDKHDDWWVYREFWMSPVRGVMKALTDQDVFEVYSVKDYCGVIAYLEGNSIKMEHPHTDLEYGRYADTGGENIIYRFMDQAGKGFHSHFEQYPSISLHDLYKKYGLAYKDPYKNINAGEAAIHELLRPRRVNTLSWPKIHFAQSCVETIMEMEHLRYEKTNPALLESKELKQKSVEARRHMIDILRYLVTARLVYIDRMASERSKRIQ